MREGRGGDKEGERVLYRGGREIGHLQVKLVRGPPGAGTEAGCEKGENKG